MSIVEALAELGKCYVRAIHLIEYFNVLYDNGPRPLKRSPNGRTDCATGLNSKRKPQMWWRHKWGF